MTALAPYYQDTWSTLYVGDCREILPALREAAGGPIADSCVADPPYEETTAEWDVWPYGWVEAVSAVLPEAASFWCFGSLRMHFAHNQEWFNAGWRLGQERHDLTDPDALIWEKKNGSGPGSRDRLIKVHEMAVHYYRGAWGALEHEWARDKHYGPDKGIIRRDSPAAAHQRKRRSTAYQDDGTRQPRSVLYIRSPSVRLQERHPDEKPLAAVIPLIRESTRPGGTVLDPTAGVCTVGVGARMLRRHAILIEQDERIAEEGARRLAAVEDPEEPVTAHVLDALETQLSLDVTA